MSAATASSSSSAVSPSEADAKIRNDLATLNEKMDLCDAMLNPGAGDPALSVTTSEAMLAVIGFLEACAPRMIELVDAAVQGALSSEDVLEACLSANDRLQKLLVDVDTAAMTETSATTTAAKAGDADTDADALEKEFDDLLLTDKSGAGKSTAVGGKTTGEDDEEDNADLFAITDNDKPAGDMSDIGQSPSNDEFDEFFNTRVGN